METKKNKTNNSLNDKLNNNSNNKAKSFLKENRKQIIWLTITVIVAWFVIELISNWGAFISGLQEGINQ